MSKKLISSVPGSQVMTLMTEPEKPTSEQKLHHNVPVSLRASS